MERRTRFRVGDCVDRQEAIEKMTRAIWLYPNELYPTLMHYQNAKDLAEYGLKDVPAVEPETIRCKDCLHYHEEKCPMTYTEWISWEEDGYIESDDVFHDNAEDDGYCHKWEGRKDE